MARGEVAPTPRPRELEVIDLSRIDDESKIGLLRQLGYDSDGEHVLKDGERVVDTVTGEDVLLRHMAILPGSVRVISDNPLSIADYLEDVDEPR